MERMCNTLTHGEIVSLKSDNSSPDLSHLAPLPVQAAMEDALRLLVFNLRDTSFWESKKIFPAHHSFSIRKSYRRSVEIKRAR